MNRVYTARQANIETGAMVRGRQRGVSIVGLILGLAILAVLAVLGLKIVPTYLEYRAINTAIAGIKGGASVREIQVEFDRRATVAYITAIAGKDLEIVKNGAQYEIAFAYAKKIALVGPASLLLEYAGSTDESVAKKAADEPAPAK